MARQYDMNDVSIYFIWIIGKNDEKITTLGYLLDFWSVCETYSNVYSLGVLMYQVYIIIIKFQTNREDGVPPNYVADWSGVVHDFVTSTINTFKVGYNSLRIRYPDVSCQDKESVSQFLVLSRQSDRVFILTALILTNARSIDQGRKNGTVKMVLDWLAKWLDDVMKIQPIPVHQLPYLLSASGEKAAVGQHWAIGRAVS